VLDFLEELNAANSRHNMGLGGFPSEQAPY
jgi:hypothetical protein